MDWYLSSLAHRIYLYLIRLFVYNNHIFEILSESLFKYGFMSFKNDANCKYPCTQLVLPYL
jgi:hypothetical protein